MVAKPKSPKKKKGEPKKAAFPKDGVSLEGDPLVGARRHLYITEWMRQCGFSDESLGEKMDLPRQTIYRWRTQEHRVTPHKQFDLAIALGIDPTDLWRLPGPPNRRSIDEMLASADDKQMTDVIDFVNRYVLK